MKNNLVQFSFIVLALVVGGALEDMLPTVGALGAPVLLSLAVFFALGFVFLKLADKQPLARTTE